MNPNKDFIRSIAYALAAGLVLRVVFAFYSIGFDHPNEPYRFFEPLSALLGNYAQLPFEWTRQLLSQVWIQSNLPMVEVLKGLGLSPLGQWILVKIIYASLGCSIIYAGSKIVQVATQQQKWVQITAWSLALFPELIYQSARMMDYHFESVALAAAVALNADLLASSKVTQDPQTRSKALSSGVILGLVFFARFQTGLIWLAFFSLMIVLKSYRSAVWFTFGYLGALLVGASIEAQGHQGWFLPFQNYLHFNWYQDQAALQFGADPWHRYLTEIAKYFGVAGFVGMALFFLIGFRRIPYRLVYLAAFSILIHSFISHKEGRFIFGVLWLWIPALIISVQSVQKFKYKNVFERAFYFGAVVLVVFGWMWSASRVYARSGEHRQEVLAMSEASQVIQKHSKAFAGLSVWIDADPVFVPASFLLGRPEPFCHLQGSRDFSVCPKDFNNAHLWIGEKLQVPKACQVIDQIKYKSWVVAHCKPS